MSFHPKTLAREYAFKFLYNFMPYLDFQAASLALPLPADLAKQLEEFDAAYAEQDSEHPDNISNGPIRALAQVLIEGVLTHAPALAQQVEQHCTRWKFKNIDHINQTILLLAAFELQHQTEVPAKVVINEAVNLAKKFGQQDSFAFVNGILDNMAKSH
ncbi:MAG: transcription antitermination factor NusB [Bacteriovoracaceae bacterium]|nr:transcription antitermination factor NusB [Bacteriovoracaceae bacterium]